MAAVCVYCASGETIDESYKQLAGDVGAEIARRGHSLVSGGGRVSMMGAVARAARTGGAHTVGVIPQALRDLEVADDDAEELLVTPGMRERKGLMDSRADALVALPGGLGPLEELLEVWVARGLGRHDKPVVVVAPDGVYAPLRAQVDLLTERHFVRPAAREACAWAGSVDEAFDALDRMWASRRPERGRTEEIEELLEAEP